ncbi:MAG: hypothetical protein EZS28_006175 [Streblomastix strix]|uniref:Uncharacterized protein n=1 Tax=Streblomastix strix TaxID=222440 RepID=A0A5J4WTR6_9EUKA|nr:MAG: hypothetical protein EZS28_006175 [Streblomastix strix]
MIDEKNKANPNQSKTLPRVGSSSSLSSQENSFDTLSSNTIQNLNIILNQKQSDSQNSKDLFWWINQEQKTCSLRGRSHDLFYKRKSNTTGSRANLLTLKDETKSLVDDILDDDEYVTVQDDMKYTIANNKFLPPSVTQALYQLIGQPIDGQIPQSLYDRKFVHHRRNTKQRRDTKLNKSGKQNLAISSTKQEGEEADKEQNESTGTLDRVNVNAVNNTNANINNQIAEKTDKVEKNEKVDKPGKMLMFQKPKPKEQVKEQEITNQQDKVTIQDSQDKDKIKEQPQIQVQPKVTTLFQKPKSINTSQPQQIQQLLIQKPEPVQAASPKQQSNNQQQSPQQQPFKSPMPSKSPMSSIDSAVTPDLMSDDDYDDEEDGEDMPIEFMKLANGTNDKLGGGNTWAQQSGIRRKSVVQVNTSKSTARQIRTYAPVVNQGGGQQQQQQQQQANPQLLLQQQQQILQQQNQTSPVTSSNSYQGQANSPLLQINDPSLASKFKQPLIGQQHSANNTGGSPPAKPGISFLFSNFNKKSNLGQFQIGQADDQSNQNKDNQQQQQQSNIQQSPQIPVQETEEEKLARLEKEELQLKEKEEKDEREMENMLTQAEDQSSVLLGMMSAQILSPGSPNINTSDDAINSPVQVHSHSNTMKKGTQNPNMPPQFRFKRSNTFQMKKIPIEKPSETEGGATNSEAVGFVDQQLQSILNNSNQKPTGTVDDSALPQLSNRTDKLMFQPKQNILLDKNAPVDNVVNTPVVNKDNNQQVDSNKDKEKIKEKEKEIQFEIQEAYDIETDREKQTSPSPIERQQIFSLPVPNVANVTPKGPKLLFSKQQQQPAAIPVIPEPLVQAQQQLAQLSSNNQKPTTPMKIISPLPSDPSPIQSPIQSPIHSPKPVYRTIPAIMFQSPINVGGQTQNQSYHISPVQAQIQFINKATSPKQNNSGQSAGQAGIQYANLPGLSGINRTTSPLYALRPTPQKSNEPQQQMTPPQSSKTSPIQPQNQSNQQQNQSNILLNPKQPTKSPSGGRTKSPGLSLSPGLNKSPGLHKNSQTSLGKSPSQTKSPGLNKSPSGSKLLLFNNQNSLQSSLKNKMNTNSPSGKQRQKLSVSPQGSAKTNNKAQQQQHTQNSSQTSILSSSLTSSTIKQAIQNAHQGSGSSSNLSYNSGSSSLRAPQSQKNAASTQTPTRQIVASTPSQSNELSTSQNKSPSVMQSPNNQNQYLIQPLQTSSPVLQGSPTSQVYPSNSRSPGNNTGTSPQGTERKRIVMQVNKQGSNVGQLASSIGVVGSGTTNSTSARDANSPTTVIQNNMVQQSSSPTTTSSSASSSSTISPISSPLNVTTNRSRPKNSPKQVIQQTSQQHNSSNATTSPFSTSHVATPPKPQTKITVLAQAPQTSTSSNYTTAASSSSSQQFSSNNNTSSKKANQPGRNQADQPKAENFKNFTTEGIYFQPSEQIFSLVKALD